MATMRSFLRLRSRGSGACLGKGYFAAHGIIIDPQKRFEAKRVADKYRLPAHTRHMYLALIGCWTLAFAAGLVFAVGCASNWSMPAVCSAMVSSMVLFIAGPALWFLLRHRRAKALKQCVHEMTLRDIAIPSNWADNLTPEQFAA